MKQYGFTIVELLIAVSIIGILIAVVFVRTDLMQSDAEVNAASQKIVNLAKKTRQQSISVAEFRGIFPSYGLYFDMNHPEKFVVYVNCRADDDGSLRVDHDDNFAYNNEAHEACEEEMDYSESNPALVSEEFFRDGAFVHKISVVDEDVGPDEIQSVSINFLRPEPSVWITKNNEEVVSYGYVKITVRDRAERYEKDVIFYTTALVETSQRKLGE